jgi:hypothetical protein
MCHSNTACAQARLGVRSRGLEQGFLVTIAGVCARYGVLVTDIRSSVTRQRMCARVMGFGGTRERAFVMECWTGGWAKDPVTIGRHYENQYLKADGT